MARVKLKRVAEVSERNLPVFAEFDRMVDQIRAEAHNLFSGRGAEHGQALDDWLEAEQKICWPATELAEQDDGYLIKVAMAGFEPKEITVTATPSEILVKAAHEKKSAGGENRESKIRWSEFRSNDVVRRIELPSAVNVGEVSASLKNGLLEISVPRADSEAGAEQKIEVSTPS